MGSYDGRAVPDPTTFFRLQKQFLYPVVHEAWLDEKKKVKEELLEKTDLCIIGDARCDSPGYSAKYSTYTIMDSLTNKIIDYELVQVTEVSVHYQIIVLTSISIKFIGKIYIKNDLIIVVD